MPWWLLIKRAAPSIKQLFGIQPAPQPTTPQPVAPQPQPEPEPQPKTYQRVIHYDGRPWTDEYVVSGNRMYNRWYSIDPSQKSDTTITVSRYPDGKSLGVYRSPYYDGNKVDEPMDVDSWNQVNDEIDAAKRNFILGRQFGGDMPSKRSNEIKNISKKKTYYGGELDPAIAYAHGIYGGYLPEATVVAKSPTYYGGELDPAVVYGDEPTYYGGELPGATVYANEPTYYGGELPGAVVYGTRPRKRNGSL